VKVWGTGARAEGCLMDIHFQCVKPIPISSGRTVSQF